MRGLLALCVVDWAAGLSLRLNPVTRVAQLLENLREKVVRDGEAEQEIYDQYKCWCTKTLNAKSASMEANRVRISELAAYIDDLESGRVELTSERSTLEAEVKELETAIADAETMREKEHEEFLSAEDEMTKGVAALESALETLETATEDHKDGGVLASVAQKLAKAVDLGRGFMQQKDVQHALRVLDVPTVDNKMLNKDTTFNKKYAARSGEIQNVLTDMLASFRSNLNTTQVLESKAKSDFDSLMSAKTGQLDSTQAALRDKSTENGARATAVADSQTEKDELETQNTNDAGFFQDTTSACETKAGEWSDRKKLRADELASIGQAISTLRSDDARDLFKKSYASLLQVRAPRRSALRARAVKDLRAVAAQSGDPRVSVLATKLLMGQANSTEVPEANPFDEVISEVGTMIADLGAEAQEDADNKGACERDQLATTQRAKELSKAIDTNTAEIDRLSAAIKVAKDSMGTMDQQVAMLTQAKEDATLQRNKEHAQYEQTKLDDQGAVDLIETAVQVLEDFYTRNNLNFAQGASKKRDEPFVAAGEAPPDAPATWDSTYGGAKGETNGIVAIMNMLKTDIENDITQADTDENEAAAAHTQLETDIDTTISELQTSHGTLDGQVSADEQSVVSEESMRDGSRTDLDESRALLADLQPGCDFIRTHFAARKAARDAEMAGLTHAKTALEEANFS